MYGAEILNHDFYGHRINASELVVELECKTSCKGCSSGFGNGTALRMANDGCIIKSHQFLLTILPQEMAEPSQEVRVHPLRPLGGFKG